MKLRDYQQAAIDQARAAVLAGRRAVLIVSPTGSGKTTTGAAIARGHMREGKRVVWLAHRRELVRQAADTLEGAGLDVGANGLGASKPVQVASVQGLLAAGQVPPASLVVFDEAHHFVADEWSRLAEVYKDAIRIGLTATPERLDGRGLGEIFDELVIAAQLRELIARGFLASCDVYRPSRAIANKKIAQEPVDAWLEHGEGKSAVVFAQNVKSAHAFAEGFCRKGVAAGVVTGAMRADDRDKLLARFAAGELRVVCNVQVLTEGWDCARAKCGILARGCSSDGLYLQIVGRFFRPWGIARATIIDLCGVVDQRGAPDADREYSLEGIGIRLKGEGAPRARYCRVCKTPMDLGVSVCGRCGSRNETTVRTSANVELERFSAMRRQPEDARIAKLRSMLAAAEAKGHNPKSVAIRFKAIYGYWPNRALLEKARASA